MGQYILQAHGVKITNRREDQRTDGLTLNSNCPFRTDGLTLNSNCPFMRVERKMLNGKNRSFILV